MDKSREAFENSLGHTDGFHDGYVTHNPITGMYESNDDDYECVEDWLNGAWTVWQSRQAEVADKDQRIHELNETSLDLEGQIYKLQEQLNEKDKRIESLIAQIEMSDFKDSLGHELKSNLAYLDLKALRGEHE